MHVSYAELVRIAPEAIRMTGFTFGQADDAVEGIVWTECVLGHGYDLLRMADQERPAQGWPPHSVTGIHSGVAAVELMNLPLFGFAARLADWARSVALESGGFGTIMASGAFGGWIAPYIAYRLARANHDAAVLWLPGPTAPVGEAPATLALAAASAGPPEKTPLLIAPGGAYGVTAKRRSPQGGVPSRLLNAVAGATTRQAGSSVLVIATASLPRAGALVDFGSALDAVGCAALARATPASLDGSAELRRAIDIGIEVAPEDHRVLTLLSQRIRLPNTERSKSQAG